MSVALRIGLSLALLALAVACTTTPAPATAVPPTQASTAAPPASDTPAPSPTLTPEPTEVPTVEIKVYFTDRAHLVSGEPPFEAAVVRTVPAGANLPEAALDAFFAGPTAEEQAQGLELLASGFTGWSSLEVHDGIARVHLSGPCITHGAAYTIASALFRTLTQFDEIRYVKIYDSSGDTGVPDGPTNSIPACLEP